MISFFDYAKNSSAGQNIASSDLKANEADLDGVYLPTRLNEVFSETTFCIDNTTAVGINIQQGAITERTFPVLRGKKIRFMIRSAPSMLLLLLTVFGSFPVSVVAAPVTVDLTTFTSDAGARFVGGASSALGKDIAIVGDHNGDGFTDYIIGSRGLNKAVVVMKRDTTYLSTDLLVSSLVSGQYFRVIKGPAGFDPSALDGIGDINGDLLDDVIVGANNALTDRGNAGIAFVIFGMVGPFTDLELSATWAAPSLGFMIVGPTEGTGYVSLPRTARGLGDVNGDGVNDFAVSARAYKGTTTKTNPGVTWVIFGKKSGVYNTIDLLPANFGSNGVYYTGAATNNFLGYSVMPAGDFNGDGIADFLISAVQFTPPAVNGVGRSSAGIVYLIYGSKTSLVNTDMSTFVTGSNGVRFLGAVGNNNLGNAAGSVGDVNGDGIDDIALGAPYFRYLTRSNSGVVYVIFGSNIVFAADVDLLNFAASSIGFPIYGRDSSMQLCVPAPAGDINRDGVNDILVGGIALNSRAHIIFGQTAARTAPVDTAVDDVITLYLTDGAYVGSALDGGKDLNGDGILDILIGGYGATVAPEEGGATIQQAGAVWMIPGPFTPIADPTAMPSLVPSATPTFVPSPVPSESPSQMPSEVPSAVPSDSPTLLPSADPSAVPSEGPSVVPSAAPTFLPSASPSENPSQLPTETPSITPTTQPSANPSGKPSQVPSLEPSAVPTVDPSVNPTTDPSVGPTLAPTLDPSVSPSQTPSVTPSSAPTTDPTAPPSQVPSVSPSRMPSMIPSAEPTIGPSVNPTANPTFQPTFLPTAGPSTNPTADPTNAPSLAPSSVPTAGPSSPPTAVPSLAPTARPSVPAFKDFELAVNVEQGVFFMTGADYNAQQAAYNKTIQHTVADATDGVTPERVTDIAVEEEEEEEGRISVEKLRTQLVQAAQEGKMDRNLRTYAAQFGATGLNNSTFALPQVTSAAVQRDASSQLTGVQTALLVIGVMVGLALGIAAVLACNALLHSAESAFAPAVNDNAVDLVL